MKNGSLFLCVVALGLLLAGLQGGAAAQEVDCLLCHGDLPKKKTVHAALGMGCTACHTGIDAGAIPHKKTNKNERGLSSPVPDLCYGCHDKAAFSKKHAHPALFMGCTSCHDPHSSDNEKILVSSVPGLCFNCHDAAAVTGKKAVHPPAALGMCSSCHNPHSTAVPKLLVSEPPDLCFGCHDRNAFEGKVKHAPAGVGLCLSCHAPHQSDHGKILTADGADLCYNCHDKEMFSKKNVHAAVLMGCTTCHNPHRSEEIRLLSKRPVLVCLDCHAEVRKGKHAVTGFSARGGHPLGSIRKPKKPVMDPARRGVEFYCGSCHDPHSSNWVKLYRYKASTAMGLCQHCHKY